MNLPDPATHWCAALKAARPNLTIVAEVKTKSPFKAIDLSRYGPLETRDIVRWLDACPWADIISVHTNPLWGGTFWWLEVARGLTKKPILAKGFHDTIRDVEDAFKYGADCCLTVNWWPGDERCWMECHSGNEIALCAAPRAVWNARNPRTGGTAGLRVHDAVRLRKHARWDNPNGWVCQASMIRCAADVHPEVDAVLIGEGLLTHD